ncbi:recombinase family protein [Halodesulfovibrio sp.]|uniref:recombinase family protein n=1 Tax=Halodesulfovibrio sp. TaxID=1912772 RepID=UPI0025BF3F9C|nr:recombinase family protein [Halodesulfovibrio sp.]
MTNFAYCRVSTLEQDTTIQEEAIKKAYPDAVIRTEKKTGTNADRPVLQLLLEMIGKGDKLVVWKLDRLARNLENMLSIVRLLDEKGASLVVLDQNIDTTTAAGKAFLQMLGVFAEFETNIRKERQAEGIAKAKAEGKYKGRKRSHDREAILEMLKRGVSLRKTAEACGCSLSTVQRVKKEGID